MATATAKKRPSFELTLNLSQHEARLLMAACQNSWTDEDEVAYGLREVIFKALLEEIDG
ncbi:hypothetical protein REXELLA_45 [Erwinia phage vB_EamP_Rexella]|uniref:Uncharacterized protein n=1 Tax=Erwinia phage vB_EamP_Rexella TaxID=1852642 RepID=A0A191ZD10_9CAUD|nr:hypothetical protein REXELLA_45 [Erwinia phage vB_EamP_Rexella]